MLIRIVLNMNRIVLIRLLLFVAHVCPLAASLKIRRPQRRVRPKNLALSYFVLRYLDSSRRPPGLGNTYVIARPKLGGAILALVGASFVAPAAFWNALFLLIALE